MRNLIFVSAMIVLTACSSSSPSSPGPIDVQFTLAPGQRAAVGSAGASITFVAVTTDSRCPAAAICVSAGDAIARVEMARGVTSVSAVDLHTNKPRTAEAAGFTIELLELAPYPITWNDIQPSQYRATIRVSR